MTHLYIQWLIMARRTAMSRETTTTRKSQIRRLWLVSCQCPTR
nr:MAG TPA: hypothetical protein [Caudoviricetes sp.]